MTLSILKDRALVKLFGTKPPAAVPMQSFALWAVRSAIMGKGDPKYGKYLGNKGGNENKRV